MSITIQFRRYKTHLCLAKSKSLISITEHPPLYRDNMKTYDNWALFFLVLFPLLIIVSSCVCSTLWWTCCLRWWWVSHTLCAASNPTMTGRRCDSARRGWWCSCATQGSWRQWTSVAKDTPTASCLKSLSTGRSVERQAAPTLCSMCAAQPQR